MRTLRAGRVLRGTLAAGVATFIALMSHVAGGGEVPGWLGIVGPLLLSIAICTVLAGRKLSLTRLALAVGISQLLFHTLFVLGAASGTIVMSGHHHGAMQVIDTTVTLVSADSAMWVSHAIAAVITTAALFRGEQSVVRLLGAAAGVLRYVKRQLALAVSGAPVLPSIARTVPVRSERATVLRAPFHSSVARRGPPAQFAL